MDVNVAASGVREKISLPGVYRGYSEPVANGYDKVAVYVPVRDGCRLAVDIYRPTRDGAHLEGALPTIFVSTGYRRSFLLKPEERLRDKYFPQFEYGDCVSWVTGGARLIDRRRAQWFEPVEHLPPEEFRRWLLRKASSYEYVMMHGYNFVIFDNRATGASFGNSNQLDHQTHGMDICDILDWAAGQPWSDGNHGMMGASWLGLAQNAAISCLPRNLKAVMPLVAGEDTFQPMYPGGLYNVGLMRGWYALRDENERGYLADVVDEDPDGTMMAEAIAQREAPSDDPHWVLNIPRPDELEALLDYHASWSRDRYGENGRYYDRDLPDGTHGDWTLSHLDPRLANQTDVAYYGYGGFWDLCGYTMAMAYADLTVPQKLTMGPWHHSGWIKSETEEGLRWMDYHLKGIPNGIMDEPPVVYATSRPDAPPKWFGAGKFPPAGVSWKRLYGAPSGDDPKLGRLGDAPPAEAGAALGFTVDYETTSGLENRHWGYFLGPYLSIGRLETFRDEILTFMSEPLAQDLEITGYPVLKFTMTIDSDAGAVFAYLQDVAPDGAAWYVSEGQLNLRDRKVSEPPFDYLGLPYHSILEADRLPVVPGEPMEIAIALTQVSWIVPAGHRLCLTIAGADKDNSYQRVQDRPPKIEIECGRDHPLTLDLPVLGAPGVARGTVEIPGAFADLAETSQRAVQPDRIGGRIYEAFFKPRAG